MKYLTIILLLASMNVFAQHESFRTSLEDRYAPCTNGLWGEGGIEWVKDDSITRPFWMVLKRGNDTLHMYIDTILLKLIKRAKVIHVGAQIFNLQNSTHAYWDLNELRLYRFYPNGHYIIDTPDYPVKRPHGNYKKSNK